MRGRQSPQSAVSSKGRRTLKRGEPSPERALAEPVPRFIQPCLATLVSDVPSGDQWVHEIKYDGYRLQVRIEDDAVVFLTRSGLDWTHRFAALKRAFAALHLGNAIIDGEAVVIDGGGRPDFAKLVEALKEGRSERIIFYAFDLLYLGTARTTGLPLKERKCLLKKALRTSHKSEVIRFSEHLKGRADKIFEHVCDMGLEGIVSKRVDSPYRSGRGHDWVKTKCIQSDEFVVGGYLESTAYRNAVGALALGAYREDGAFIYCGRVGTGFNRETAREMWNRLQPLRRAGSAFAAPLVAAQRRGVVWVEPEVVVQIEYRGWTGDGLLRHASFAGVREDKPAHSVGLPRFGEASET